MNYKRYWDNFNTDHYLEVVAERKTKEIKREIEEDDFNERMKVLIGFIFLVISMFFLFKALEFLY